ncbi:serine hydrolase domain-containing protein [Candidatus Enterococcus ikei]|uniref:Beta-lactamase family protein n=1 Tax=Candidatus Enterococcus ikei TaxID=2815326 RepID=A0ABS3H097_9ENTE|nr:serine hydrolase domain-containing protein [Enterococcus sp. DIV0869a]MBO0440925.1 beta-lactamase family protein [Enterococcus sp. DIV0869a]
MHHRKHHKKSNPWIPAVVILLLIILVGLESYLLFFYDHASPVTKETAQSKIETPALTHDAQQADNFNQEVSPSSDLAKQINQKLEDKRFIGTALVIQNGQIILQKGFGYANFAKSQPNTYQSLFQIGSIQKALTAALVLQQVQAQKLSLDDTLNRFYPSVQDSQKITIRQLLSMNSGLYQKIKPNIMMSDDAFLQFAISNATMSTYGQYKYDAINYYLLVGILEQLTGTSYCTLFNQTFIQKLHLNHTLFYSDFLNSNERTYAYERVEGKDYGSEIADKPLLFKQEIGTGSIGMTVGDLYVFFSTLLSGNIVDKDTLNSLWTPETQENYTGGIYNYKNYIRGHGVEEGFEPNAYISKDKQNAVILFTNQNPKNQTYTALGKEIFDLLGSY